MRDEEVSLNGGYALRGYLTDCDREGAGKEG
jgi:hypothetical protein